MYLSLFKLHVIRLVLHDQIVSLVTNVPRVVGIIRTIDWIQDVPMNGLLFIWSWFNL
jgi:hypothetical protein